MRLKIFTDGGARGNPGPAAVGIVICDQNKNIIKKLGRTIGITTNNIAEYTAVINALEYLLRTKDQEPRTNLEGINFYLDSELIVGQLTGVFKTKNAKLRDLLFKIRELEAEVGGNASYSAVPREENKIADRLVNEALNKLI